MTGIGAAGTAQITQYDGFVAQMAAVKMPITDTARGYNERNIRPPSAFWRRAHLIRRPG